MKHVLIFLAVMMTILMGCDTDSTDPFLEKLQEQENMANDLMPSEFSMIKISDDEYKFDVTPDGVNTYILKTTLNNGAGIILLEGGDDNEEPDCYRGKTFEQAIKNNYEITEENDEYFFCNTILNYRTGNSAERFSIWKIVLKQTEDPNVLEVVEYDILGEDY